MGIEKVLERILKADRREGGERFVAAYQAWVERVVTGGEVVVPGETVAKNKLKKNRAGGQNVQKNRSAVQLTHLPTLIFALSQKGRGREVNAVGAQEKLKELLSVHRDLWVNIVGEAGGKEAVRRVGKKLEEMTHQA